jgi:hypothetical protein
MVNDKNLPGDCDRILNLALEFIRIWGWLMFSWLENNGLKELWGEILSSYLLNFHLLPPSD